MKTASQTPEDVENYPPQRNRGKIISKIPEIPNSLKFSRVKLEPVKIMGRCILAQYRKGISPVTCFSYFLTVFFLINFNMLCVDVVFFVTYYDVDSTSQKCDFISLSFLENFSQYVFKYAFAAFFLSLISRTIATCMLELFIMSFYPPIFNAVLFCVIRIFSSYLSSSSLILSAAVANVILNHLALNFSYCIVHFPSFYLIFFYSL